MAGLILDPAQQLVLQHGLGETGTGRWSAFEVAVMESRQNGKGAILEARELSGLFLLGERLIIHSAHMFDTSLEAFQRLLLLIEDTPDFDRRVKRVSRAHGDEGIELKGGQRIRYRTRTKGGGRGFTGDCLILDEAMVLPEAFHGALLPTLSARSVTGNPQVWYTGSAVDQNIHEHGVVFARVRDRALKGTDPALAYFEWSIDRENPDAVDDRTARDPKSWAQANPGLGIRISEEHVERERRSMDTRTFAVERLGVGDWPNLEGETHVIDLDLWRELVDEASVMLDPVCFAFDVAPDRSWASIAAAAARGDGLKHVEVVDRRRGTGWVVDRLVELREKHAPAGIVCDGKSPAASLLVELEQRYVKVTVVTANDHAAACGLLYDLVEQKQLRHLGTQELESALRGAAQRPLSDAWAWSRKNSSTDISPLVACTLALWGHSTLEGASIYEERGLLIVGR